ncbi:hypothetical protein KFE98_04970 [bacterium SCSIO 12741]|nr:hypothetical protein KFE98_04970 [bacterium SCSIO 12741]
MKKNLLLSLLIFLLSPALWAQSSSFKVLSVKGDNAVQKEGTFQPIGPGTELPSDAKIMVAEGGSLQLMHASGQSFNLHKTGIYTLNDAAGNFEADNSSLAQRYLTYVMNEMQGTDDSRTANMSITGSVERSVDNYDIKVYSPETTYILNRMTSVKWDAKSPSESYKVEIFNLFDESVITLDVKETVAAVDLSTIEFEEDAIYKLVVTDADNKKSRELILRIPTGEEMVQIEKDLAEINKEADPDSPLYHALLAEFYKINGLYMDAVTHYEKAIALAPESEMVQKEYDRFLKHAGVKN